MSVNKDGAVEAAVEMVRGMVEGRADGWEIFCSSSRGVSIEARDGAVDALKARSGRGIGVRTISGGRPGFSFSTVFSEEALTEMVSNAVSSGAHTDVDKFLVLPGPAGAGAVDAADLDIYDPGVDDVPEQEKIDCALAIEEAAMARDPRVKRVRKAAFGETVSATRIVNSLGVDESVSATYYTGSVTAVAESDGESQMGWEMTTSHKRASIDPAFIGESAADRATALLGGRKIKGVKCPAVLEYSVVCDLLGSLSGSFLGDNVAKGKSMLADKLGERVASTMVNILDDGLLRGGWSTSVFDGEGVGRQRTPLVTDGVCGNFLYDTYWAGREGKASTGNASRGGYKGLPTVGVSNLYIEKGDLPLDGLLGDMTKGLFITEVLGVHMINTVSGDFSLGASGFWVEDGRRAYPVRGMAISGNLLDLFGKVARCASDLRFLGSIGAPSLLVSELEASGS